LVTSVDDPVPLVATGRWHGRILDSPQGGGGFGYDPLFGIVIESDPTRQCSAAELAAIDKRRLSHRAQALKELVRQLQQAA
jgi:XTP/dITP diphosphohydrolase